MPVETREHPRDGSLMVLVPAGNFIMGRADNDIFAEEHEKPSREIHLSSYWIDVYPVTNSQFKGFLLGGGYETPKYWSAEGWKWLQTLEIQQPLMWGQAGWDGPDQPVAGVSWYEADAYARSMGRALPTDCQWEKAARGTDGRQYPWGNDWPTHDRANFDSAVGRTTPVGLYPAGVSPYGCHDMAGNVNNWTRDWYWEAFGDFCTRPGEGKDPCCDEALWERLRKAHSLRKLVGEMGFPLLRLTRDAGFSGEQEFRDPHLLRVDRGGGFATDRECQEVLSCTRKVHWTPETRAPWNGFRTVMAG